MLLEQPIKDKSPEQVYHTLRQLPYPVLLESAMLHEEIGQYSFAAADPFLVCEVIKSGVIVNGVLKTGDPLVILRQLFNAYRLPPAPGLPPFIGGAIGFFSYDLGEIFEKLPGRALDDLNIPGSILCFYDTVFAWDHTIDKAWILSSGFPHSEDRTRKLKAAARLSFFSGLINFPTSINNEHFDISGKMSGHFDQDSYCRAVQKAIDYILSGDIFQVNLSQRFSIPFSGSPFELYCRLKSINPAPFASIMEWQDFAVVSASPERFLRVKDGWVETRPIKGTRPRGKNAEEDKRLRDELWHSKKDKAELTMIVDLERNDLGRVSVPGTVRVPELFRLEKYATVWHLVATVTSRLRPEFDIFDLLRASFPGGSITGAPKIRAMEIIDELEPVKRGIYTGSIGYIGFNGETDLNIVIRTFVIKNNMAHIQVGGGITADSQPLMEYEETLHKGRALFNALDLAGGEKC